MIMQTLKVKSILFSLLAIMMVSVFLSSCSQNSMEEIVPTSMEDEELLGAILLASKGKLTQNAETYSISLSREDLGRETYEAITNKQALTIDEDFVIAAADVKDIFCVSERDCILEGDYTFEHQNITVTSSANVENRGCITILVRVGIFWVWVTICV